MNISQAKQIPVSVLVEQLGGRYSHNGKPGEIWFYSPFRPQEKTASFKIDERANTWHDFGHVSPSSKTQGSGGDILNLWCDFYGYDRKDVRPALQGLAGLSGSRVADRVKQPTQRRNTAQETASQTQGQGDRFQFVKQPTKIFLDSLKAELSRRGIGLDTAQPYLKQATIRDTKTGRQYVGFGFQNNKGGWEISIPNPNKGNNFKTVIGPKAPTYIAAPEPTGSYVVFEGNPDFLTWLEMNKGRGLVQNAIILNSVVFVNQVAQDLIDRRNSVVSVLEFFDHDAAGENARNLWFDQMAAADMEQVGSSAHIYQGYDDLNAWWMNAPGARATWKKMIAPAGQKIYYDPPGIKRPTGYRP